MKVVDVVVVSIEVKLEAFVVPCPRRGRARGRATLRPLPPVWLRPREKENKGYVGLCVKRGSTYAIDALRRVRRRRLAVSLDFHAIFMHLRKVCQ